MFTFTCEEKDCPNKGIDYNLLGSSSVAECGGCATALIGTNERPDPELQQPSFANPE